MNVLVRLLLPLLALLLLAAHYYRADVLPAAALCAVLILLLAVPRPWAARIVQAALVLGAVEWLRALAAYAALRAAAGQPFLRLALILGAVAAFTLLAAGIFQHRALKERFGLG